MIICYFQQANEEFHTLNILNSTYDLHVSAAINTPRYLYIEKGLDKAAQSK